MILADKIVQLRKKAGMSQEELAEKVGVSRQAVSKWESSLATPDINKIISMSEIFGVSTDFLLKDSEDAPEDSPAEGIIEEGIDEEGRQLHPVDLETANRFLANNEKNAVLIGIGVMLCIFSPALLIRREGPAGAAFLIIMIGIAVTIFVSRGQISQELDWLKNEPLDTAYGIDGMVKEKRKAYSATHTRDMTIGILLCVISSLPLFLISYLTDDPTWELAGVSLILVFVGIGVFLIVRTSTIWSGYQVLLEEGDYTRQSKKVNHKIGGIYWGAATAIYLLLSFLTGRWDLTWILWPVAGVSYGIVFQILKAGVR